MRLTPRCLDLLKLLRTARWLSTSQIQRRFFPRATPDAVRKRLRKLTAGRYLTIFRRDRMSQALFTIGPEGKRILDTAGIGVDLERTPPKQLEHFMGVNDLRIAAELAGNLKYFYAAWELPRIGWQHTIIPDGLVAFGSKVFALEFDRGVEGLQFFLKTKMTAYQRGLDGLPLDAVLIVADRASRLTALRRAIGTHYGRVLFASLEQIRGEGFLAPVFCTDAGRVVASLVDRPLLSDSLVEKRVCGG
jgi:Replication-relaxation